MKPPGKNEAGASLVELLTATAVASVLLVLMLEFTGTAIGSLDRDHSRTEALRLSRNIVSLMSAELASVCRSASGTNLVIHGTTSGDGEAGLAALITRPGDGADVCAVGYRIVRPAGSNGATLVREFTPANETSETIRRGEDPLTPGPQTHHETLATGVLDLRFMPIPRDDVPDHAAFTTNLPEAIEVTLSVAAGDRAGAIRTRCRLPLR